MAKATLTEEERRIIKNLLSKGQKSQTILALINTNRVAPVNGGRISGIKKDAAQQLATDGEVELFKLRKVSYDPKTGLNQFDDERLVRAREAMILAVQVFNSASLKFKTEVFSVLSNIAWTYLLHEFYDRKGIPLVEGGKSIVLSKMLDRADCPLPHLVKENIKSIKVLRDEVEHLLLGPAEKRWFALFQASCLNFDKAICDLFGERLTLANDLSFALQFSRPDISQLSTLLSYDVPPEIAAIDARLHDGKSADDLNNVEYQFKVVYTLVSSEKSNANVNFITPSSADGVEIHNILTKKVPSDDIYPHKANIVVRLVSETAGKKFTTRNHTQAWKLFRVRPINGAIQPSQTDKRYCIYHAAHRDYTYSDEWINRLIAEVADDEKFAQIKNAPA